MRIDGPDGAQSEQDTAYRLFLNALEEFWDEVALHGTASTEAALARAKVSEARLAAIHEWRREQAAA